MFLADRQRNYHQAPRSLDRLESQLYHEDCEVELKFDQDPSSSESDDDTLDEMGKDNNDDDEEHVLDLPLDFRHAHRPPGIEKRRITILVAASSSTFALLYLSCWVLGKLIELGGGFASSLVVPLTPGFEA